MDEDAIFPSKGQGVAPTGFDVESQTARGGIKTPPTSSMTLFCAHADSRSPKDYAPHASHRYNHGQSSSGSQIRHLSTNPNLLTRVLSSNIQKSISIARDTRGLRNHKDECGESLTASMNVVHSTHQFADAATAQIQGLRRCVLFSFTPRPSGPNSSSLPNSTTLHV